jgi:ribonuclease III
VTTAATGAFQDAIGFQFHDPLLLLRALTHRSYLNEVQDHPVPHYERFEFLGDAILDFLVGEYLFHHVPDQPEGELTLMRSSLVRTDALARFAEQVDLGDYILMGRGEEASGGRVRPALLADAFEALVAAMYLDQGMEAVSRWIANLFQHAVADLLKSGGARDAKSQLQEVAQAELGITPVYELIEQSGLDHERMFTIAVRVGDEVRGVGSGRSKQIAAQAAARAALLTFDQDG